jgi:plasmid rolling circle replication initiator protein Rep
VDNPSKGNRREGNIYTLAQSAAKELPESATIVTGNGSDATNKKLRNNRAKRKLITATIALKLVDYSKSIGDEVAEKQYWKMYRCQQVITKANGRTYGRYCKHRLCTLCTANRKAELINKYLPVISGWEDPYFVTITSKACSGIKLKARINNVIRAFQIIKKRIRDKHRRGKCQRFIGVRSLECNFNPIKRTYNPHFHIIVDSVEMADLIIEEWTNLWTKDFASIKAQHKRRVKKEKVIDLIETIKYGAKIFVDPEKKGSPKVYAAALHNINEAMKGHRLFDRFGFNLPKGSKLVPKGMQVVTNSETIEYNLQKQNWIDVETCERLTDFIPNASLSYILDNQIDIEVN